MQIAIIALGIICICFVAHRYRQYRNEQKLYDEIKERARQIVNKKKKIEQ